MDRNLEQRHGPVIARIVIHADGYAMMRVEVEVPRLDIKTLIVTGIDKLTQKSQKTAYAQMV